MNFLELKIPPPVVALCGALLMWFVASFIPPIEMPRDLRLGLSFLLVSVGLAMDLAGILTFWRANTTINPIKPLATSALVSHGIYAYTRNPMYLGLLLCLLAWAVYLAQPWALLIPPAFVMYLNRFQILPEERALSSRFGDEYMAYKNRVRRWL